MPSVKPSVKASYVEVRTFAHATEDLEKVLRALYNVIPSEFVNNVELMKEELRGHHGNPIVFLKAKVRKKEAVNAFVKKLSMDMSELDKEALARDVDLHVKGGSFYIRLNKQAAYKGELKICTADPIHVRVQFKSRGKEDVIKACKEAGLLS